jgi:hypothetical protein
MHPKTLNELLSYVLIGRGARSGAMVCEAERGWDWQKARRTFKTPMPQRPLNNRSQQQYSAVRGQPTEPGRPSPVGDA